MEKDHNAHNNAFRQSDIVNKGLSPEEVDRQQFIKGQDPEQESFNADKQETPLKITDDTKRPKTSGNIDRTFLDHDEQDEDDDEKDDSSLEDEEDWVEGEFTGDEDDLALNANLDEDLNLASDEDGDFLSLQDEDDEDDD